MMNPLWRSGRPWRIYHHPWVELYVQDEKRKKKERKGERGYKLIDVIKSLLACWSRWYSMCTSQALSMRTHTDKGGGGGGGGLHDIMLLLLLLFHKGVESRLVGRSAGKGRRLLGRGGADQMATGCGQCYVLRRARAEAKFISSSQTRSFCAALVFIMFCYVSLSRYNRVAPPFFSLSLSFSFSTTRYQPAHADMVRLGLALVWLPVIINASLCFPRFSSSSPFLAYFDGSAVSSSFYNQPTSFIINTHSVIN